MSILTTINIMQLLPSSDFLPELVQNSDRLALALLPCLDYCSRSFMGAV